MNERGTGVLEQYGLEVYRTGRTRGAVLCETGCGLKLLKEWTGSERRIRLEYALLRALYEEAGLQTDCCIKNLKGELVSTDEDQAGYVVRDWYEGRECSAREPEEILKAAGLLARLHLALRKIGASGTLEKRLEELRKEAEARKEAERQAAEEAGQLEAAETELTAEEGSAEKADEEAEALSDILARHNRELKRARSFVKGRRRKTDFELVVIGSFEKFYRQAEEAAGLAFGLGELPKEQWCHGEYSHHHVLFGDGVAAVTDFSRMRRDVQAGDLYYFTRKVLEKHRWNLRLGRRILEAYTEILPLTEKEWKYLYILFLYPEKYWKQMNYYLNSNKAWIPARNIDKLRMLESQFEPREQFLEELKRRAV